MAQSLNVDNESALSQTLDRDSQNTPVHNRHALTTQMRSAISEEPRQPLQGRLAWNLPAPETFQCHPDGARRAPAGHRNISIR
jgi:hypothetical protein